MKKTKVLLNISKVFTVANMAGAAFGACCVDGPHWIRAAIVFAVCFMLMCFFMVSSAILEEAIN